MGPDFMVNSYCMQSFLGDLLDETEVLEWLIQQQSFIADEDIVER